LKTAVAVDARIGARVTLACVMLAIGALLPAVPAAMPLTSDELATVCAQTEGSAHCARKVEAVQLKRLPNLATRDGATLTVGLYPSGTVTFADTEALNGGRSYSLWDYINELNAVVLFTTDGANVTFTLLQRTNGRKIELPAEPKVSPDRARLVTADFCASSCINELAVWRVTRDGVRKEYSWKPKEAWADAGASWKDADTIVVEYTREGASTPATLERKLTDPGWLRYTAP
jgi:hypothetical protein